MVIAAAVRRDGSSPAVGFIRNLDDQDRAKVFGLFRMLNPRGELRNREKFKKIDGKLFEFKSHQIRIPCFRVGSIWVLTHGFIKKSDEIPPSQITLAERIREEDLERRR